MTYDVTAAARLDVAAAYHRLADLAVRAAFDVTGTASGPGDEQEFHRTIESCLLDVARRLDALDGARRGAARGRNSA